MTSIAAFLFLIGLLVFVHELGHFLAAKRCGVRVEQFSLGFGPALAGFTRGETEYKICALPFGGYVKMSGEGGEPGVFVEGVADGAETPFEKGDRITLIGGVPLTPESRWKDVVSQLRKNPAPREVVVERKNSEKRFRAGYREMKALDAHFEGEYPRSFSTKTVAQRLSIVTAGPLMNFALPFLLLPAALMAGMQVPAHTESEPVVRRSAAVRDGKPLILKGDRIVRMDGKPVKTWGEVSRALGGGGAEVAVEVEREGGRVTLEVARKSLAPEDMAEPREPVVGGVADGSPAHRAGLQTGDRIAAVGGEEVREWGQMAAIIRRSAGKELELSVVRGGETLTKRVVPQGVPGGEYGFMGVTMKTDTVFKRFGFAESITGGIKRAADMTKTVVSLFFGFLFAVFGGEMSLAQAGKNLAGPLFIAKTSGVMAQQGLASLLVFASFISVNLAVVNLLPIPVLDGGHVVHLAIEAVRGKPLSRATLETAQRIGFLLLIAVMLMATYNDIANLWGSAAGRLGDLSEFIR